MYTMGIELITTWALLKQPEGVTIGFIKGFSQYLSPHVDKDCLFDVTSNSLHALLQSTDKFKWSETDENTVVFTDAYRCKLDKVENNLIHRQLPRKLGFLYLNLDYSFISELNKSLSR